LIRSDGLNNAESAGLFVLHSRPG